MRSLVRDRARSHIHLFRKMSHFRCSNMIKLEIMTIRWLSNLFPIICYIKRLRFLVRKLQIIETVIAVIWNEISDFGLIFWKIIEILMNFQSHLKWVPIHPPCVFRTQTMLKHDFEWFWRPGHLSRKNMKNEKLDDRRKSWKWSFGRFFKRDPRRNHDLSSLNPF